jgi:hypothetical protein
VWRATNHCQRLCIIAIHMERIYDANLRHIMHVLHP